MSIKISKSDIVWNYAGNIMTLGANLFLLPFILRFLSASELGLWYTFAAVGNIAVLFDFGFKATMGRNVTYAWCGASDIQKYDAKEIDKGLRPNFILMNRIMKVSRHVYLVISVMALLILGTLGTLYVRKVSVSLSFESVLVAWGIYVIGVFFNLYYGYFNAFLSGVGAIKEVNISNVISRALQLIVAFVMLKLGYGILSMSVAYCIFCLTFRLLAAFFFSKYEGIGKELKKCKEHLKKDEFKRIFGIIWHNAWRDGIVSFSTFLNGQATTLLCSWYLSLEDTATYGLSMQLVNAIASISSIYFSTFQSKMQEQYIERDIVSLRKRLSSTLVMYVLIYLSGAICVCTFGKEILRIIKSNTPMNLPLMIVLFIYMFLYKNHTLFASYLAGTNRIIYTKAYVISSILMVVISAAVLAFTDMGVWTLAIIPLIVECVYNVWHWPQFVLNELDIGLVDVARLGIDQLRRDIA